MHWSLPRHAAAPYPRYLHPYRSNIDIRAMKVRSGQEKLRFSLRGPLRKGSLVKKVANRWCYSHEAGSYTNTPHNFTAWRENLVIIQVFCICEISSIHKLLPPRPVCLHLAWIIWFYISVACDKTDVIFCRSSLGHILLILQFWGKSVNILVLRCQLWEGMLYDAAHSGLQLY
jgi:hypothetical protein